MQQISHDTGDIKQGKTYEELQRWTGLNKELEQRINAVNKRKHKLQQEIDEQEEKDKENIRFNKETKKKIERYE